MIGRKNLMIGNPVVIFVGKPTVIGYLEMNSNQKGGLFNNNKNHMFDTENITYFTLSKGFFKKKYYFTVHNVSCDKIKILDRGDPLGKILYPNGVVIILQGANNSSCGLPIDENNSLLEGAKNKALENQVIGLLDNLDTATDDDKVDVRIKKHAETANLLKDKFASIIKLPDKKR